MCDIFTYVTRENVGAEEMTEREDAGLVPSTHFALHDHL